MKKAVIHLLKTAVLALGAAFLILLVSSCTATKETDLSFVDAEDGCLIASVRTHGNSLDVPREHLGRPVVGIADNAFYGNQELLYVRLPETLRSVGAYAFSECVHLEKVVFEKEGACVIGEGAFSGCVSLSTVELSSSVYSIGDRAFHNCRSLGAIDGAGILNIGADAFKNCEKLIMRAPENSYAHSYALSHGIEISRFSKDLLLPAALIIGVLVGTAAIFAAELVKKRKKRKANT